MRVRRLGAAVGAALVAAGALGALAWHARPLDPALHTRVMVNLSKLQELDSELDETVLKLRELLLGSYDPLVAALDLMRAHLRDLEAPGHGIVRAGGAELEPALAAVAAKIAEKEARIETFKSQNALLRNSFHYFPLSVEALLRDARVSGELRERVHRLMRDILLLRLGATATDFELVGLQIAQLEAEPVPAAAREKVQLVLLHGRNVLQHQVAVDRLVRDITGPDLTRAAQALAETYSRGFQERLRDANVYRFVLLLASAGLLAYAAFAFLRLRRSTHELKLALERQSDSEERYRKLFDLSPDGMLIHTDGTIVLVNSMCMKLLGARAPEELIGRPVLELFQPEYRDRVRERMRQTLEQHRISAPEERKVRALDGAVLDVEVAASPFTHLGKPSFQVVMRDVSERKKAQAQLTYLAQYDSLTGLPNRSFFRDRLAHDLEQARRSGRPAALLFIDLDGFKMVNDTRGHAVGDKLLLQVGERLKSCVRSADTVARFGGDEFGVILVHLAQPGDAALVAQKINEVLAQPFDLDGQRTFVSASIGITLYPGDAVDVDTLSMNADTAMYRAKELGRNTYQFFTPQMNERAKHRMQMELAMRLALERGEFVLHYQPKVELESGTICGLEALLRWQHPQRGLASPAEFVPVLEETGLIVPVGEWVMREACDQLARW